MIKSASWTHGTSVQVETPQTVKSITRYAFFTRIVGKKGQGTWVHFAIPTPVIADGQRLRLESAMIRFRSASPHACIAHFHVCDGEERFFMHDHINIAQDWGTPLHREVIRPERVLLWGIGISLYLQFNGNTDAENTIELAAAGGDFIQ